jgi:uncharacterized protein (DUF1800 family)
MDDRQAVSWLHRRAGFGLHPEALEAAIERGPDVEIERLVRPDENGVPDQVDPWDGFALDEDNGGRQEAVAGWLRRLLETARPFQDRRTWMLHGWLVSSMGKVRDPDVMVEQIRLFADRGGSSFPALLNALTTNRAMLVYLDGRTSTLEAPNENYGRELLELFALGVGNYTEDDVQAAARALTGWVVARRFETAWFVPGRHDNAPQTLLGTTGVDDVGSVIDAVVAHSEHPRFVARRVVQEYLGDPDILSEAVEQLAVVYDASGRSLDPVIEEALRIGLEGTSTTRVLAPIPWLAITMRATGVRLEQIFRAGRERIREMGQTPFLPPSVAGWPSDEEWFTSSSIIARTNLAATIAGATGGGEPLRVALDDDDLDLVAARLGLSEPFSTATTAAIGREPDAVVRLTLALVSPENLLS